MKNLLLLHLVVLIFGFTGILGKLISVPSDNLVWYRMLIGSASIAIYLILKRRSLRMPKEGVMKTMLTGFIIAAHWILFFEAIKQSNVSVTLAALATASLFTSLLEPLFFKRRIQAYELLLGTIVLLGLYFIFQFETNISLGLGLGILSAILASLFTVINGLLVKQYDPIRISFYELMGGVLAISIYLIIKGPELFPAFNLNVSDSIYLLILGVICTAFAFVASVKVMEELTPFTVSLSVNLEPVYGIIMAILFFGDTEKMSSGFYAGTCMILASLFINALVKRAIKRKQQKANF